MEIKAPDENLRFAVLARLCSLPDGKGISKSSDVSPAEYQRVQVNWINWNNLPSLIKELPHTKIKREFERNQWPKFEKAVVIAGTKRNDHAVDIERAKELLILGNNTQEPDLVFQKYVSEYTSPKGIVVYVPGLWRNITFLPSNDKTIRIKGVIIVTPELTLWCEDLKIRHLKEKIKVSQGMENAINFARNFFSSH
jgi:hypothetical protein